ncbi:hypothetical protein EPUL_000778 [Erysiphe pulchra]|uniref:Uncharacterized protein n=1 Tax=Erysiphe pulchra TaxID=225359 RepID=A0A2S4Q0B5_9PEZI|nr:hypothetical protein EPUL_000778 [Erysiphe pulchra]
MSSSTSRKRGAESPKSIYSIKSRCRPVIEGRVDSLHGQRSALPGLDGEITLIGSDGEFSEDGENNSNNALAYLAAVRQEAIGIPTVLYAPKTNDHNLIDDDFGALTSKYEDGAYLSISDLVPEIDVEYNLQESFLSILSRYQRLRNQLNQAPPEKLVSNLKPYQRTNVGPLNKDLSRWWMGHLRNANPNPVQVASMDKITVLRLLGLLSQGSMLKTSLKTSSCPSLWIWSLLARLPDRGDLSSEEIAIVRGLGKKAVSLGISLKEDPEWGICLIETESSNDSDMEKNDSSDSMVDDEFQQEQITCDNSKTNRANSPSSSCASDTQFVTQTEEIIQTPQDQQKNCESSVETLPKNDLMDSPLQDLQKDESIDSYLKTTGLQFTSKDFAAAKERVLENFCSIPNQEFVNLEPEIINTGSISDNQCYSSSKRWNAQATVDMIITIVGELYGQLDLLESRGHWDNVV